MDVRRPRSLRRVLLSAAVTVTVAGLLTACGMHPGSAAVIEGRSVPTSEIVATLDELAPVSTTITAQTVIGAFITEPVLVKVAGDHGVSVTTDDATAMLDGLYTAKGLTAPSEYSDGAVQLARYALLADKLNSRDDLEVIAGEYGTAVQALDVAVNPRFGTFDHGEVSAPTLPTWVVGSVVAQPSAEPTAEPTAAPTAAPSPTSTP